MSCHHVRIQREICDPRDSPAPMVAGTLASGFSASRAVGHKCPLVIKTPGLWSAVTAARKDGHRAEEAELRGERHVRGGAVRIWGSRLQAGPNGTLITYEFLPKTRAAEDRQRGPGGKATAEKGVV